VSRSPRRVSRTPRIVCLVLLAALAPGCLTYETSQTRVAIDKKGLARVEVTFQNVATTETGRTGQWEDFEQLDSLRRSDAYFASSFLRSARGARVLRRRVWLSKDHIHASYVISTRDLNQIAEGWSADSTGYRYTSLLTVARTNGKRTTDEKPTVVWPRSARLLLVTEKDPHFSEAVPFLPEIRKTLAARLKASKPAKVAKAPRPSTR
jgi:hypothetical protein